MAPVSLRYFKALMGFVHLCAGRYHYPATVSQQGAENLIAYVPQSEEADWSFPVLVEDVVMMGRYGHMGWLRRPTAHDHACVLTPRWRVGGYARISSQGQIGEPSRRAEKRVFLLPWPSLRMDR